VPRLLKYGNRAALIHNLHIASQQQRDWLSHSSGILQPPCLIATN